MLGGGLRPELRLLALVVGCIFFMEQLDTTILASVLPVLARDLETSAQSMNLALAAYLISQCVYIPASGWLADRFGTRRIFTLAIVVFTLGSILCSLASSLAFLVVARIMQGIGGSMMLPVGRLVLLRSASHAERLQAMSVVLLPGMLGPALGPSVGGLIVTWLSWHWIFYINVPIGMAAFLLSMRHVPQIRAPVQVPFDWRGLALLSSGLISVIVGLELASHPGIRACGLVAGCGAAALLAAYAVHAKRVPAAVIRLDLLDLAGFRIAAVGGTLFRTAYGTVPFLLPMLLQLSFGLSPAHSGILTSIGTAGGLVMKGLATGVLRRFGFRNVLLWNGLAAAMFLISCAAFSQTTPELVLLLIILAGGIVRSLQFNAYGSISYADVPAERMSTATSFNDMLQQLSLSIGVSLGALMLSGVSWLTGDTTPKRIDISTAFLGAAVLASVAVAVCRQLPHTAGSDLLDRSLRTATQRSGAVEQIASTSSQTKGITT